MGNFMAFFPEKLAKARDPFGKSLTYDENGRLTWKPITNSKQGSLLACVRYKEGVLVVDTPSNKKY